MSLQRARFVPQDTRPPQIVVVVASRRNGGMEPNIVLRLRPEATLEEVHAVADLLNYSVDALDLMLGL